jgi:hypothetical protein
MQAAQLVERVFAAFDRALVFVVGAAVGAAINLICDA